jgi:hypothetical protein
MAFTHAAQLLHLHDVGPGPLDQLVGEGFHIVGAAPGVNDLADAGLVLDVQLGVPGDTGGEVGRKGDGFVERVGVQRLCVAESCCP